MKERKHKGEVAGREDGIECGKRKLLESHSIDYNYPLTTIDIYFAIKIKLEMLQSSFSHNQ